MYKNAYFCVNCDGEISWHTMMHSHGRCPLCGYKGEDAGTIIETKEMAYTMERIEPFWKFWKPRFKKIFHGIKQ